MGDGVWHSEFREKPKSPKTAATPAPDVVAAAESSDDEDGTKAGLAPAKKRRADLDEAANTAARPTETEEERLRAKALMPKKHKRLLQRIEKSAKAKTDQNAKLTKRRKESEVA